MAVGVCEYDESVMCGQDAIADKRHVRTSHCVIDPRLGLGTRRLARANAQDPPPTTLDSRLFNRSTRKYMYYIYVYWMIHVLMQAV